MRIFSPLSVKDPDFIGGDSHYKFPDSEIAAVELELSRCQRFICNAVDHMNMLYNNMHNAFAASKVMDYFIP